MAIRLFPAIDIRDGRAVRLRRGDFTEETVFSDDPVDMAQHWLRHGARYLHVVDLDGAKEGAPRNLDLIRRIVESVPISVQVGGGIRTIETLEAVRSTGVARIIIGTAALLDQDFLRAALGEWGERLVVAVDAEDGMVKTHGWREKSSMTAVTFTGQLSEIGVREVIYTDISRDGMMRGINVPGIEALARESDVEIIASGGVTDLDDLRTLKRLEPLGVTGVIAGRALYEQRFTLEQALAALES